MFSQEKEQLAAVREALGKGRFVTIYSQVVRNNLQGQVFLGTGKFGVMVLTGASG